MSASTESSTSGTPLTCVSCKAVANWLALVEDYGHLCFYCLWIKTGLLPLP